MTRTFTPREAAAIAELPSKRVYAEIRQVIHSQAPHRLRFLELTYLRMLQAAEYGAGISYSIERRRHIYGQVKAVGRSVRQLQVGAVFTIDLSELARQMEQRLADYDDWESRITADPSIMGGEPVFPGTRLPVYQVGALINRGEAANASEAAKIRQELQEDYPELTQQDFDFARIYASANSREGRPSKHEAPT